MHQGYSSLGFNLKKKKTKNISTISNSIYRLPAKIQGIIWTLPLSLLSPSSSASPLSHLLHLHPPPALPSELIPTQWFKHACRLWTPPPSVHPPCSWRWRRAHFWPWRQRPGYERGVRWRGFPAVDGGCRGSAIGANCTPEPPGWSWPAPRRTERGLLSHTKVQNG